MLIIKDKTILITLIILFKLIPTFDFYAKDDSNLTTTCLVEKKDTSSCLQSYESATTTKENINNDELVGLLKLCIENEPDGFSIVEDSTGNEIFLLFKEDTFWMKPVEELYNHLFVNYRGHKVFSKTNELSLYKNWPTILTSVNKFILSFNGLNSTNYFHNNVLVFKESELFRYKVDKIDLKENKINVELLSKHSLSFWHDFVLNSITLMYIGRGSRVLVAKNEKISLPGYFNNMYIAYVLNNENLDGPVDYYGYEYGLLKSNIHRNADSIKYLYETKNKKQLFFDVYSKELCFDKDCKSLHDIIECEVSSEEFFRSFAYYLWQNTDLTIRLILVGLSSIMIINLILAISFIYHQIGRFSDLT